MLFSVWACAMLIFIHDGHLFEFLFQKLGTYLLFLEAKFNVACTFERKKWQVYKKVAEKRTKTQNNYA